MTVESCCGKLICRGCETTSFCKRRVAEKYDEKLFNEPPPPEDCPICFLPLKAEQHRFIMLWKEYLQWLHCCAMIESEGDDSLCAFCRKPDARSDGEIDADALNLLAGCYARGIRVCHKTKLGKGKRLYLKEENWICRCIFQLRRPLCSRNGC